MSRRRPGATHTCGLPANTLRGTTRRCRLSSRAKTRQPTPSASPETWSILSTRDPKIAEQIVAETHRLVSDEDVTWLAGQLAVTAASLKRLGVGYYRRTESFSFPMRDGSGQVIGIRTRDPKTGAKRSVFGSRSGLFIPTGIEGDTLFVAEGATDVAALLDVGLAAVGRPDCHSCKGFLVDFAQRYRPTQIVVVADSDEVGRRGAKSVARRLRLVAPVHVVVPSAKDARDWIAAGATRDDLLLLKGA